MLPNRFRKELGLIFGWFLFPLVPVVLENLYCEYGSRGTVDSHGFGPDPHDWDWLAWVIMLGPLVGYGFLAGATLSVPDDDATGRRGLRRLVARRAVWVAIGPWWGAVAFAACVYGLLWLGVLGPILQSSVVQWGLGILAVTVCGYSWLWPAWSAVRRAARVGQWKRSLVQGIVMAGAFVGSLFGSFWAATAMWRSYFFNRTLFRSCSLRCSFSRR